MHNETEARPEVISGEQIYLTTVHRQDAPNFAHWWKNLELTTYLGGVGFAATLEDEEAWFERAARKSSDVVHFTIVVRATGQAIGNVSLMDINHRHGMATLGVAIGPPECWGQGYGTEAVRLMVEYGFYFLNLYTIRLWHVAFNERGNSAYLKAGFREVGRARKAIAIGGERFDEVLMDIVRDDVDLSRMRAMIRQLEPQR